MAYLNKKEFAGQTGQTTKSLAVYIKRGKVVVRKDGLIDTKNETNQAFIADKAWKEPVKDGHVPVPEKILEPNDNVTHYIERLEEQEEADTAAAPGDQDVIWSEKVSRKRYQHFLAKKTEAAEKLDQLKIKKLQGDVIPVGPIEQLIFRMKQHMLTQQKTTFEAFLNEVGHKYGITGEDMAYYREYFIKKLNEQMEEVSNMTVDDLGVILNEFTVKKGRGERG